MTILKLLAAGTLGYFTYLAWQRHRERDAGMLHEDDGTTTTPHGDLILAGERIEVGPTPHAGAQSSRGFGEH